MLSGVRREPLRDLAERRIKAMQAVEEVHLAHLGALVQWQQKHATETALLDDQAGPAPASTESMQQLLRLLREGAAPDPAVTSGTTSPTPGHHSPSLADTVEGTASVATVEAALAQPDPTAGRHQPPMWLWRNWPALVGFGTVGYVALAVWRGYDVTALLLRSAREARETLSRFVLERMWEPMVSMYNTVRYDQTRFALQSAKSLESDYNSLTRMVLAFGREALSLDDESLSSLEKQVREEKKRSLDRIHCRDS